MKQNHLNVKKLIPTDVQNPVWQNKRILNYVNSGGNMGYVGSSFRSKLMDRLVTEVYEKSGALEDTFAQFLCSKDGRHLSETLGEYDDDAMINVADYEINRAYYSFLVSNEYDLIKDGIQDIEYLKKKESAKKSLENIKASPGYQTFNFTDLL